MTETNVSLHKETLGVIEAFLKSHDFPASTTICEGLVTIVNQISDYHEEGTALKPDILLIKDEKFFSNSSISTSYSFEYRANT